MIYKGNKTKTMECNFIGNNGMRTGQNNKSLMVYLRWKMRQLSLMLLVTCLHTKQAAGSWWIMVKPQSYFEYGSFHVRWSSKMGIFHLILTKIHKISKGERSQASELNKVGIF